jgi:hypothetical protein
MSLVAVAHVTRRGRASERTSMRELNALCAGSGARISRYLRPPSEIRAFRVPIPGCVPPIAAFTPVVFSTQAIPRSRSPMPSRR